jgi:cysteine-rich repeat protein
MTYRWVVAVSLCLITGGSVVSAKLNLCPPGRFELGDGSGAVLQLSDDAMVEIEGACQETRARGRFLNNGWVSGRLGRFRVGWTDCDGPADKVRVRARIDDGCQTLRGIMRKRSVSRAKFTASRVPVCGDLVVSPGEDCDDGNEAVGDCCVACRGEPGCWIPCERTADCALQAVCARHDDRCRATSGICRPRYEGQCQGSTFQVCGCDGNAYPNECAAWEAGVTTQGGDGLNQRVGKRCYCRPEVGRTCGGGRFCDRPYLSLARCGRDASRRRRRIGGICVDASSECASDFGGPVCGCDGRTYRNHCERRRARVQILCTCSEPTTALPGGTCGGTGAPAYACDCSGATSFADPRVSLTSPTP